MHRAAAVLCFTLASSISMLGMVEARVPSEPSTSPEPSPPVLPSAAPTPNALTKAGFALYVIDRGDGWSWLPQLGSKNGVVGGIYFTPKNAQRGLFTWNGKQLFVYPTSGVANHQDSDWYARVYAVNDAGIMVGSVSVDLTDDPATNFSAATRYAGGTTTFLALGPGARINAARAINERGDIVGSAADGRGFLAPAGGKVLRMSALAANGFRSDVAFDGINQRGDIIGYSTAARPFGNHLNLEGTQVVPHAVLLRGPAHTITDLGIAAKCGRSQATALDDAGDVDGTCGIPGQEVTVWQWRHGTIHTIGTINQDGSPHNLSDQNPNDLPGGDKNIGAGHHLELVGADGKARDSGALEDLLARCGYANPNIAGETPDGLVYGTGQRGDADVGFVLATAANSKAAAFATLPDDPVIAGVPEIAPGATPAPPVVLAPITAAPLPRAPAGNVPQLAVRWKFALPSIGADYVKTLSPASIDADDDTVFLSQRGAVKAIGPSGAVRWTAAFPGSPRITRVGSLVIADDSHRAMAFDAVSGAKRWTIAQTRLHAVQLPLIATGGAFIAFDNPEPGIGFGDADKAEPFRVYSLASGKLVAKLGGYSYAAIFAAGGAVQGYWPEERWVDGMPARTVDRPAWTFDEFKPIDADDTSLYGTSAGAFVDVHPATQSYDALTFPLPDDPNRAVVYDTKYVYVTNGGTLYRYARDSDPLKQRVRGVALGNKDGAAVIVPAGGPVYARSKAGGFLAIRYDAAGTPSAVAEPDPDAKGEGDRPLSIGGGYAFLTTATGLDVIDPVRRRLVARANLPCDSLIFKTRIARTLVVGCHTPGAPQQLQAVYGLTLPPR